MTQKERNEKRYKQRRYNGLCPRCGKPLDRDGYYCTECLEKVREYNRANKLFYRENGICVVCGKEMVLGDEKTCPMCRAKMSIWRREPTEEQKEKYGNRFKEYQKSLYQERKANGICTRCGKRKAAPQKTKCVICLEKDAENHRKKRYGKPKIREERLKNHLCLWCGEPAAENNKLCYSCLQKAVENGKKSLAKNKLWKAENKLAFMK